MTAPEAPPGLGPRAPSTMDRDVTTRSTPYSFQEIVEEERKLLRELRQRGPAARGAGRLASRPGRVPGSLLLGRRHPQRHVQPRRAPGPVGAPPPQGVRLPLDRVGRRLHRELALGVDPSRGRGHGPAAAQHEGPPRRRAEGGDVPSELQQLPHPADGDLQHGHPRRGGHVPQEPHPQSLDRPPLPHGRPASAATVRVGREAPPRLAECPARVRRPGARGRRVLHQPESRQPASLQPEQS